MTPVPVLEMRAARAHAQGLHEADLDVARLVVNPGELALVLAAEGAPHSLLADAAAGLAEPESGSVLFCGEDWRALRPDRAAACRSRIGRVFDPPGWVSNLDIDENVTLVQRHHTRRPVAEILEEAQALARGFGLPGLPEGRPLTAQRADLRRAEWIRALLGSPALLLLENPDHGVYSEQFPPLVDAVEAARARGAAVVWICDEREGRARPELRPTQTLRLVGGVLRAAEEGGG